MAILNIQDWIIILLNNKPYEKVKDIRLIGLADSNPYFL